MMKTDIRKEPVPYWVEPTSRPFYGAANGAENLCHRCATPERVAQLLEAITPLYLPGVPPEIRRYWLDGRAKGGPLCWQCGQNVWDAFGEYTVSVQIIHTYTLIVAATSEADALSKSRRLTTEDIARLGSLQAVDADYHEVLDGPEPTEAQE